MKIDYCTCIKPKYAGDSEEGYYCDTCEKEIGEDKFLECEAHFAGENEWRAEMAEEDRVTQDEEEFNSKAGNEWAQREAGI